MPVYAITLEHREKTDSPHSHESAANLRASGADFGAVEATTCYLIEGSFDGSIARVAATLLADTVLESATVTANEIPRSGAGTQLTIMRREGVMDPTETSLFATLSNAGISAAAVKQAHIYRFARELNADEVARAYAILGNDAIEECHVGAFAITKLALGKPYEFARVDVPIAALDAAGLQEINKRHGLSMNGAELAAVQTYFKDLGRDPSDIELEMLAQTWSEHCKHKTLTGPVYYVEEDTVSESVYDLAPGLWAKDAPIPGLLQSTIKRATEELDRDFCWSVFVDNAGVIALDDEDGICIKVETHNHPSAIEPYGGAGTGIGGVIRDILGTGKGAKPIMNTNVFCFGYPDMEHASVPKGALHPLTTMRGVVSGVRDYGNRMGIPTANGALYFDQRYTGNPLVYAGSIGIIPKDQVHKAAKVGDKIVAVGGRTGRDGIGGATFSSVELTEDSEVVSSGAVQIGNAIQEKVVLDTLLQARDRGLYNGLTDCGAGGFSSAVGEMGELTGAHVELSHCPLKYDGLSYREIWLSEAQERMVFAVPPENLEEFLAIFAAENVETAVIGTFSGDGQMIVKYQGHTVLDMPMSFLHDGLPKIDRHAVWKGARTDGDSLSSRSKAKGLKGVARNNALLTEILSAPNVCSKEYVVRQYDHEVQAMSAIKPFCGIKREGPSDAAAIVPKRGSDKALVVGCGLNPHFGDIDPYWMAMAGIDEAVRNVVATGGNIDHTAILDNFSWGNCSKPERLGELARACVACYVAAKALGTPFVSGKDSLSNEFATEDGTIAIPATLLITAASVTTIDRLTTMDLKSASSSLWQIGKTFKEFGGSHAKLFLGDAGLGNEVPRYDADLALKCYRALNAAQAAGIIRSAHDCSEGGLAVTLAEMAFAGGLGVSADLTDDLAGNDEAEDGMTLAFAESNGRIVVEVASEHEAKLLEIFDGLPITQVAEVNQTERLTISRNGEKLIDADIWQLRDAWKSPLYKAVGEAVPAS